MTAAQFFATLVGSFLGGLGGTWLACWLADLIYSWRYK